MTITALHNCHENRPCLGCEFHLPLTPMLRAGFYLTVFPQSKTVMKRATVYKTLATCWTWCEMPSKPFLPRLTLRPPVGMPYDPRATGVGITLPKILNTVRSTSDSKECSPCNRHWVSSLRLGESRPGKVKLKCFIIIYPKPHLNLVFPGWLRIVPPPPPVWMTRISSLTSFGGDTEYYKSKHTTRPHLTMTFWRILQSKHAVRHANILLKSLSGEGKKKA